MTLTFSSLMFNRFFPRAEFIRACIWGPETGSAVNSPALPPELPSSNLIVRSMFMLKNLEILFLFLFRLMLHLQYSPVRPSYVPKMFGFLPPPPTNHCSELERLPEKQKQSVKSVGDFLNTVGVGVFYTEPTFSGQVSS